MWNKKFCFKLFEIFQAVHKSNPRMHSLKQSKKAMLTTAVYFKVSTPI